jgi:murein DD-endopeptidase MepM/ murein hydrolase activator NlpD
VGYATLTGGTFHAKSPAFAAPITGLTLPGVSSSIPPTDQSVFRAGVTNRTIHTDPAVTDTQRNVADQLARIAATATPEPTVPAEDPLLRAAAVAPPPPEKLYDTYIVVDGDTVSKIAAAHGLTVEAIVQNNPEVPNSDFLTLGQQIIIPPAEGILYNIRLGDTISDIASEYGVSASEVVAYPANRLTSPDDIKEATYVFVPGGKRIAPVAVPLPLPSSADAGGSASAGIVAGGASSGKGLIWPVNGPISSPYGSSHPLGIDIDGYRLSGAPVGAATSGTVIFAGGNACCSYGLYVVVMSPGGIETLYAHLSSIVVSQGQTVEQGEELGVIGSTGYSTGVHLHLEVIDNGARENPVAYLP